MESQHERSSLVPDYERVTVERVRQAQSKTGLPFCRTVYRKHNLETGDPIALCPLEHVLVAEGDPAYMPPQYLTGFVHAVDGQRRRRYVQPDYNQGYEDGLAVREEFFDDDTDA